jgi:hypothetical protein
MHFELRNARLLISDKIASNAAVRRETCECERDNGERENGVRACVHEDLVSIQSVVFGCESSVSRP